MGGLARPAKRFETLGQLRGFAQPALECAEQYPLAGDHPPLASQPRPRVPALAARPEAFRFGKGGDFTNSLDNQHCVSWLGCGVHYCYLHPTYTKSY